MKLLTTAIFAKISGDALSTAIGGRLFKGRADQDAEYPYVVFMVVSDVPYKTFGRNYEDVLIQFSIFSATSGSTEIEDIFTHLTTLFDECDLVRSGETTIYMVRTNATMWIEDHTLPPPHTGTRKAWHYAVDYDLRIKV